MAAWLERIWCHLRGHDQIFVQEPARLSLRCVSCGWTSPGWTLNVRKRLVRS